MVTQLMSGFVRARIDDDLKNEAAIVLDSIGLTVSDAVRMLLTRIAREKALPVDLVIPNATTIAAMEEAQTILDGNKKGRPLQEIFDGLDAEGKEKKRGKTSSRI